VLVLIGCDCAQSAAHLRSLDLSHNKLGDACGRALGDYLLVAATLRKLDLSWNNFGGGGARAIALAMGTNASVRELYLAHNKFEDRGTQVRRWRGCEMRRGAVLNAL